MPHPLTHLRLIIACTVLLFLSACGGGIDDEKVEYRGSTLVVDGVEFSRRSAAEINAPSDIYESGAVYVAENPGKRTELELRLDELGLTARTRDDVIAHFSVKVPLEWEDQWRRALSAQSQVRYAWINYAFRCC